MNRRIWRQRLALLPLWGLYVWWFRLLLLESSRTDLFRSLRILGAVACLHGAGMLLWILHNRRLAQKGKRRQAREVKADFSWDVLSRPVLAPPDGLTARRVKVIILDGRKYYLPVCELEPAAEAEADYAGVDSIR